jgi:Tol biopolymer transport system component
MKPYMISLSILVSILVWTSSGFGQQTAEELYQAGLYQEEVQGDLESAIEIYRRILSEFSNNRTVGARAQLHIGLCYEKLGLREAQQAYRRVIDDFPDHTEEVGVARDRLASLERALAELDRQPSFRKIEIASKPQNGVLSPDGQTLAFTSGGSLWLMPIRGNVDPNIAGEPVPLTEPVDANNTGNTLAWSADGEWIAFNTRSREGPTGIYVISVSSGERQRMPGSLWSGSNPYVFRVSLSPGGKNLAYARVDSVPDRSDVYDPETSIYIASAAGGGPTQLTDPITAYPAYSPNGKLMAYVRRVDAPSGSQRRVLFRQLWVMPVEGGPAVLLIDSTRVIGPVWSPDSRKIAVIREASPDGLESEVWIIPISEDGQRAGETIKIPLPLEGLYVISGWTPDDELGVFMNNEMQQAVYTVPVEGGKAVQITASGYAFHPRWTPDGKRIVYREAPTLYSVPAEGGEPVPIPIVSDSSLIPGIPGGGNQISPDGKTILFMAYKRSIRPLEVDIWSVPIEGGEPTHITRSPSQDRFPCWSADGKTIAFIRYHEVSKGEFVINIYTVPATGGEAEAITTEADSVAWSTISYSPDGKWLAYFTKSALKIRPVEGGEGRVVVEMERVGSHSEMAWSPDSRRLAYTGRGSIWVVPVEGGEPVEVETSVLTADAQNLHIDWSPDGERLVFAASTGGEAELWMISDFLPAGGER